MEFAVFKNLTDEMYLSYGINRNEMNLDGVWTIFKVLGGKTESDLRRVLGFLVKSVTDQVNIDGKLVNRIPNGRDWEKAVSFVVDERDREKESL